MRSNTKGLLIQNLLYWLVAALLYPLSRLIPSAAGGPPRIFEVLIPLFFIMLAYGSSVIVAQAARHPEKA